MSIPTNIEELLERDESTVLHVYPDSFGYWTIGTGRLVDARKGGGISREEARYLLRNDIASRTEALHARLPWFADLDEVRQAVLTSMAFQMGIDGLMQFVRTLAAVHYGKYAEAAKYMLESKWAQQTPARALRNADMMRTGEWR